MVRFLDQVVMDWGIYTWNHEGEEIHQVHVLLGNGMFLIMNIEDFEALTDDESYA